MFLEFGHGGGDKQEKVTGVLWRRHAELLSEEPNHTVINLLGPSLDRLRLRTLKTKTEYIQLIETAVRGQRSAAKKTKLICYFYGATSHH